MGGKDSTSRRFTHTFTATWTFQSAVDRARLQLRLRPRDSAQVLAHNWSVNPTPDKISESLDDFGNHLVVVELSGIGSQLNVGAESVFECPSLPNEFPPTETGPWEELLVAGDSRGRTPPALDYRDSEFVSYCRSYFRAGRPWLEAVLDLASQLRQEMRYDPGVATRVRDTREVFESRRGTCQDFAQVMLACLRSLGITAGYVQGCLLESGRPGTDQSHAWVRVFDGASQWRDIDPTTGKLIKQAVVLAWGWDASQVAPVQGEILGGGTQLLSVTQWVM